LSSVWGIIKMKPEIEKWEKEEGVEFLRKIGIRPGQTVLDFGARNGHYTIPAAKIVGEKGIVYALDKNSYPLDELMGKAKKESLENIKRIDTPGRLRIPLREKSIDVILLYDVIHLVGKNDSSTIDDRRKLYKAVYIVTRKNALISVYPTHLTTHTDVTSKREIRKEIEEAGFKFENEMHIELIHDDSKTKGDILNFRKR